MSEARPSDAMPVPLFTEVMSELASGVAVVTARRSDGQPVGLAVTSVSSYSAEPPSVMFSVARSSRSHDPLLEAAEHGVQLLAAGQKEVARTFAGKGEDKFAGLDWEWDGEVPSLAGTLAYLRCRRAAVFEHGDHSILVGEVLRMRQSTGEPLVYLRRRMDWRLQPAD